MAVIAEVRFAHEDGALADTLNALSALEVRVTREARTDPDQSVYLIRFGDQRLDSVQSVLEEDHTVAGITPMPGFEDQHLLGIEFAPGTKLLNPRVTEEGGFVLEARSSAADRDLRGWHERWLLPDGEALHDIWKHAREAGFEFEVLEVRQEGRAGPDFLTADALTDEQREALVTAYEQGYFTEPRETSLEELAEILDLSPTAVGGRLKRGMKSLIRIGLFVEESDLDERERRQQG